MKIVAKNQTAKAEVLVNKGLPITGKGLFESMARAIKY